MIAGAAAALLRPQGKCLFENGANLEEKSTEMEREIRSSMVKSPEPLNQTTPETSPMPWFLTVMRHKFPCAQSSLDWAFSNLQLKEN